MITERWQSEKANMRKNESKADGEALEETAIDEHEEDVPETDSQGKKVEPVWCLVANVAGETEHAEQKEKRSGLSTSLPAPKFIASPHSGAMDMSESR